MQFFGSKKAPPPPPPEKTLNQMSKEELRDKQRAMQKDLQKELREIDRYDFPLFKDRCSSSIWQERRQKPTCKKRSRRGTRQTSLLSRPMPSNLSSVKNKKNATYSTKERYRMCPTQ